MTRTLAPADAATIARARALAAAATSDAQRAWYAASGDTERAALQWPNLTPAALGSAQALLSELARLAERPDEAGTLDYLAAKVAEVREMAGSAADNDDADHRVKLWAVYEELSKLAAMLPHPIGYPR